MRSECRSGCQGACRQQPFGYGRSGTRSWESRCDTRGLDRFVCPSRPKPKIQAVPNRHDADRVRPNSSAALARESGGDIRFAGRNVPLGLADPGRRNPWRSAGAFSAGPRSTRRGAVAELFGLDDGVNRCIVTGRELHRPARQIGLQSAGSRAADIGFDHNISLRFGVFALRVDVEGCAANRQGLGSRNRPVERPRRREAIPVRHPAPRQCRGSRHASR